mmetsp:Transcript_109532/g.172700  ORF Transcript_109532/g.172700 Transcript_109532/m.172700 type:complete len:323 (-) Transcript_109532:285-1253(-)
MTGHSRVATYTAVFVLIVSHSGDVSSVDVEAVGNGGERSTTTLVEAPTRRFVTSASLTNPPPPKLPIVVTTTRTYPVIPSTAPKEESIPQHYQFRQADGKACAGSSYTENPATGCRGWSGLTEVQCQQKCSVGEAAPNCPTKPCVAAVFSANGQCDLYEPSQCQTLVNKLSTSTFKKYAEGVFGPMADGFKKAVGSPVGKGLLEGAAVVAAAGAAAGGIAAALLSRKKPTTTPPPTTTPLPTTTTLAMTTSRWAFFRKSDVQSQQDQGSSSTSSGNLIGFFFAVVGCCIITCCLYFVLTKLKRRNDDEEADEYSDAQDQELE